MAKEDVVKAVEDVIKAAKMDIKKNGCTSDKVRQLTGLVNSYVRLTQAETECTDDGKGDPNYYESIMAE